MVLPQLAVAAGAAYGTKKAYERIKYTEHDRVLLYAAKNLNSDTGEEATIYVDHVDPSYAEDSQPEPMDGKIPDLVLHDFPTHIAAEVETANTLDGEAKAQLEAFQRVNYETVLLVPKSDVAEATAFVEERVTGEVTVSTAASIAADVL